MTSYGGTPPPIRAQAQSSSTLPHSFPYADLKNTISYPGEADQHFNLAEGNKLIRIPQDVEAHTHEASID